MLSCAETVEDETSLWKGKENRERFRRFGVGRTLLSDAFDFAFFDVHLTATEEIAGLNAKTKSKASDKSVRPTPEKQKKGTTEAVPFIA